MNTASLSREFYRIRALVTGFATVEVPASPLALAIAGGMDPDPWQREYLESTATRRMLLCSRQAGKSTVAAVTALYDAMAHPGALVLIVAPSERQSRETFRKVAILYRTIGHAVPSESERKLGLELLNGSRIEALPGSEKTIRGFSAPGRVIVDEAARVEAEMVSGLLPMLAVSGGSLDLLSTPAGKQGFFYEAWQGGDWLRWEVPATMVPRITPAFLEEQRRLMGERFFRAEFMCEFLDVDDAVFSTDLIEAATGHEVAATGGLDW